MNTCDDDRTGVQDTSRSWSSRIKRYRINTGMKQAALASLVGVSQSVVSMWEREACRPNLAKQVLLNAIFDRANAQSGRIILADIVRAHLMPAVLVSDDLVIQAVSAPAAAQYGCDQAVLEGLTYGVDVLGETADCFRRLRDVGVFAGGVSFAETLTETHIRLPDGRKGRAFPHMIIEPRNNGVADPCLVASGVYVSQERYRRGVGSGRARMAVTRSAA